MKTILIVEDVELNRELLVQLLEDDYRLVLAAGWTSGAFEKAVEARPGPHPHGPVAAAHGRVGGDAPAEGGRQPRRRSR